MEAAYHEKTTATFQTSPFYSYINEPTLRQSHINQCKKK